MEAQQKAKLYDILPVITFIVSYFILHLFDWMEATQLLIAALIGSLTMFAMISEFKDENKDILIGLMASSEKAQRQYINEILADYSLYLEEQRQEDLQVIQASFNSLKDNSEINQIETNQILASLITTVNNQNN